jgi:hypothetical protein
LGGGVEFRPALAAVKSMARIIKMTLGTLHGNKIQNSSKSSSCAFLFRKYALTLRQNSWAVL